MSIVQTQEKPLPDLVEVRPPEGTTRSPESPELPEPPSLHRVKNSKYDLKRQYRKNLERAFVATLLLMIVLFQLSRKYELSTEAVASVDIKIEVADVPPTEQVKRPPPPPRPSLPIPSNDDSVPDDLTIESTGIDLSNIPPPPPPPDEREVVHAFVAYDEPPEIIGGLPALLRHLEYPTVARQSGVTATVVAKVLVNVQGISQEVEILAVTAPNMGFEEKAIAALKKIRWKPAKQRDKAIKTWISVPVRFELTE